MLGVLRQFGAAGTRALEQQVLATLSVADAMITVVATAMVLVTQLPGKATTDVLAPTTGTSGGVAATPVLVIMAVVINRMRYPLAAVARLGFAVDDAQAPRVPLRHDARALWRVLVNDQVHQHAVL